MCKAYTEQAENVFHVYTCIYMYRLCSNWTGSYHNMTVLELEAPFHFLSHDEAIITD